MKKNAMSFDEAVNLFYSGAFGFVFQSQRGDYFTSEMTENGNLKIIPTEPEEGASE